MARLLDWLRRRGEHTDREHDRTAAEHKGAPPSPNEPLRGDGQPLENPSVQAFAHNAHGIAVTCPITASFRAVNGAYAQLLGYAPEELQGHSALKVYPATEHDRLLAAQRTADVRGFASLQTCQLHRDGTLIPVQVSFASVRGTDGAVGYRIETVIDLRAQLHAEGEQRHNEAQQTAAARFRQLADSAPIGILLMDADGACTYANPCWLQITELSPEQARNDGWWDAVHADDRERLSEAWEQLTRGTSLDLEFRYRRPSSEIRYVHSRAAALRDESEVTVGYICVDVDVTEQLQQRAAIDAFHGRVRALAHRLEHLRDDERSELARKLHGTLRQDMTTLKLEIETLRGRAAAPEAVALARLAELADRSLQHLRHIAFELQPPGVEDLGLAGAMKRFADECTTQTGLAISITLANPMPELGRRVSLALYRTFQEALTNVIRHARARRVDVNVSVHDGSARLRVSDDGIGMGDKDRNKAGCFGLLSTSERLAELGGTLRVLGVAGQGTTLEAMLPCDAARRQRDSAER